MDASTPLSGNATILATREQLRAVLIRSPRFGEVWVVLEAPMLAELVAEEAEVEFCLIGARRGPASLRIYSRLRRSR